ncbi:tyrosine-protein kinase CSK-like [Apostichopus japonicus]|uniref:tyrosine-protein kinase CSK-like n=1 Tax=Stichopus japonicus TaxID=307972 RepID=UPI003AB67A70
MKTRRANVSATLTEFGMSEQNNGNSSPDHDYQRSIIPSAVDLQCLPEIPRSKLLKRNEGNSGKTEELAGYDLIANENPITERSLPDLPKLALPQLERGGEDSSVEDGDSEVYYSTASETTSCLPPTHPKRPKLSIRVSPTSASNSKYEYDYATTDGTTDHGGRMFNESNMKLIFKLKPGLMYNRWMGSIVTREGTQKCVVMTTAREKFIRRQVLLWKLFVKNTLDLPVTKKHLVKVEGFGLMTEKVYLIQEYVECQTLESRLTDANSAVTSSKPLYMTEAVGLISGILEGMYVIQSHGFLHPGFSTKKILIHKDGFCKLYDFCLDEDAVKISSLKKSKVEYSLNLFAPEVWRDNKYNKMSDVWSTAVVIWEIVSNGSHPFGCDQDGEVAPNVDPTLLKERHAIFTEHLRNNALYTCFNEDWKKRPTIQQLRESYFQVFDVIEDGSYETPRLDLYTSMNPNSNGKGRQDVYQDQYSIVY